MSDMNLKTKEKEERDSLSFEDVGTVGGTLIGLDLGTHYGWKFSPIRGDSIPEIAVNIGLSLLVPIGGSLVGGMAGKLAGRGADTVRRKLR